MAFDVKEEVAREKERMIHLRRELHRIPEPAFREEKTSKFVTSVLEELDLEVWTGVAKTGVVALLRGRKAGRTILVRADIDALTVKEETGVDYASAHDGWMHACGHDGHMAIALTVARILARNREAVRGNVKFVFQPAEEGPGGAKPMIEEGVLEDPHVDAALGLHLWNYLPVGKIGVRDGPVMASMDSFRIIIKGRGAHGAIPQDGVDAIVVAGQAINALQTIVSREVAPIAPCVVTIGTIKGGYAFNIIAETVEMEGTARALDPGLRETIPRRIERIIKGLTSGMRADYKLEYNFLYPVTVNDKEMVQIVREAAAEAVGKENVVVPDQTMGGEDMAFFLQEVPGCFFFVGSANSEKGLDAPHHSPRFNFDEEALAIGSEVMIRAVLKYLG